MIILEKFIQGPYSCPYLMEREATMEYELAGKLSPFEYEARMNKGWRKFGIAMFHPICTSCQECRPIRVPVNRFTPRRNQMRTLAANRDLEFRLGTPVVDDQRLALFDQYHRTQGIRKDWPVHRTDEESYFTSFVLNLVPSLEVSVWQGARLRGVILLDITPRVVSAVYHYYDFDEPRRSLGTLLILATIEYARERQREWVYLGYYVTGSRSMEYKARFQPCQIMQPDGRWMDHKEAVSPGIPAHP
ncbi:MAG: arginyltransferase [Candidatus Riflebacteria bacterium]|nr:arginyltransferase [Candidatus Riflebacteria bacterium]